MIKLIIAGGREFNDYDMLEEKIDLFRQVHNDQKITIISGCARGADELGAKYAVNNNLRLINIPANWNLYGKSAGYRRNESMAKVATACMVFWDGESKGSKHMIDIATKKGLDTIVVHYVKEVI